jgi:hypothetical protein
VTISEIIAFARRILREVRNGLRVAAHYLHSMQIPLELARAVLL